MLDKTIKIRIDEETLDKLDDMLGDSESRSRWIRDMIIKKYNNKSYKDWLNSLSSPPEWT